MSDGSAVLLLLRMIVSLAFVLGLLIVAARFLQRRRGGTPLRTKAVAPVIEVLARQTLSRTSSLHVVRVGEQVLALGVTESGVRLLIELSDLDVPGTEASTDAARLDARTDTRTETDLETDVETDGGVSESLTRAQRRQAQSQPAGSPRTTTKPAPFDQMFQGFATVISRSRSHRA